MYVSQYFSQMRVFKGRKRKRLFAQAPLCVGGGSSEINFNDTVVPRIHIAE